MTPTRNKPSINLDCTLKATPFDDLSSMCQYAIYMGDIDVLRNLIEDDEATVNDWKEWRDEEFM